MAAFKPLLDAECGTTNPLVKLSQIYRHVPENGLNEHYGPILAPNTFHLESLLTSLRTSDQTASKLGHQWAKEFLDVSSESVTNIHSEQMSYTYPPPSLSFILHPNPLFLTQEPSLIDTGFDIDTVRATQNILSFLEERQLAVNTENQMFVDHVLKKKKEEERQLDKILEGINPFEAGLKCLEVHDIANAIVFFQAAVRKQPDHIDAWLCLGITQTENEQDGPAIFALKKCIELDPKNLQAYITLASCYANEMLKNEAFNSLYQWLTNNKKYSHLLSTDSSAYQSLTFENLKDLFFHAVLCSNDSNEMDVDLQVCLGILFYLNDDYTKAAECFHIAVLTRPSDALLWNKLGATIANGGENEKAVNAYYHALTLSPGFIRARYNLGISCLNLKADKQAIEHFLIALKLQTNAVGIQAQMSENIWRTLASAIDRLNRSDLKQCVANRDLSKLFREFQIE